MAATNHDGYFSALHKTWARSKLKLKTTPAKSSLSEYRQKVSSKFFRDIFERDLIKNNSDRKTFRGHYIYAIDGDHLDLPAGEDILRHDYRGYKYRKTEETHYPKMYTVQAVDLINGTVARFSYSNKVSEIIQARKMIKTFEKDSIVIYDRLHQNYETALEHERHGSYFLVRVKSENPKLTKPIKDFCSSGKTSAWVNVEPNYIHKKKGMTSSIRLRFIKIKNKRSKRTMIFMTNLPEGLIKNKEIGMLYQRRWGVESSFKDLTDTLKMCQWHTSKLNGILQEIYALLWLVNNVRRITTASTKKTTQWLEPKYKKANFKLMFSLLIEHLDLLILGKIKKLRQIMSYWLYRSIENREHLSRSYPRQLKKKGGTYVNASRIQLRPLNP